MNKEKNYLDKIKEILYRSDEVKNFVLKNKLTDEEILMNFGVLSKYQESCLNCLNCNGKVCNNNVNEMKASLQFETNLINNKIRKIKVVYEDCFKIKSSSIGSLEVIDYTENDVDIVISPSRIALFEKLEKFSNSYFNNEFCKGVYLYGKCGVGKSLLIYRFAKSLVNKGAKVLFAYYPDLVRDLQNCMGTVKQEQMIRRLKSTDILIIDDIAREANNPYIRDEILGPILQYRCDNCLPMFMTSNRDFRLLEKHLSETNSVIDTVKGKALVERLKYLMNEYELVDKDYRNNDN